MRLNIFLSTTTRYQTLARALSALGPTWRSSPIRRICQSVFLVGFVVLFVYVCWPYGSSQYADFFADKEAIDAEIFLALDPLVSIATAVAARMWVWSLGFAMAVVGACLVVPRGFCGYICPLGTLLDLFDWLIGRRTAKLRAEAWQRWAGARYYVLGGVLAAATLGVMLAGFISAIAVLTRAMLFVVGSIQMGVLKGWYLVPPMSVEHWISLGLFALLVSLGLLENRFWCRFLCPSGAVFSLANLLRLTERKVRSGCTECGKCRKFCSFGAIKSDYTTRHLNCTFCQSCAGVCPAGVIEFAGRWDNDQSRASVEPRNGEIVSRRKVVAGIGGIAIGAGIPVAVCKSSGGSRAVIRPPGTVPEREFLRLCVRCGQCIKVCPNNVLQAAGFEHGIDSLWTPKVIPDWSGCEPTCNNCGHVCPTGAIRALPLEEKRAARMGLAVVNKKTCLPYSGTDQCRLCVDECSAAGYEAIEFLRVGGEVTPAGEPVEGSGFLAPVVIEDKCVGCGLCQMRCMAINVKDKHVLSSSAIEVLAGRGYEDRILRGSYIELRQQRNRQKKPAQTEAGPGSDYLPDFLQ